MLRTWQNRWRALWHPERYHGWGRTRSFFEGWYYKVISPQPGAALAIIPGISRHADGSGEAFIQVLDGLNAQPYYHPFPLADFTAAEDAFRIQIGPNHFSGTGISLDLPGLSGELTFHEPFGWPATLGAPGIMGWYAFVPFMQCYHGVWSMHHALGGQLTWQGQKVDFTGGAGYGEKDWGSSFPRGWIWTQSNHFSSDRRVSVMASVAHIPWLGSSFVGFIGGILVEDRLYRFATYTGAKRRSVMDGETITIGFRDRHTELMIRATPGPGGHLISPLKGQMTGKVNESLQAQLEVRLTEKGKDIFTGTGTWAGLEAAGEIDSLLSEDWVT